VQAKIKYICIDDDPLGYLIVNAYAAAYSELEHKGNFLNAADGIEAIKSIQPQLIFLDIEMPGLTGIELLKRIRKAGQLVVFITSHPEFALEGFELQAFDYILKPLTEQRFSQTVKRVVDYWQLRQKAAAYDIIVEQESIVIREAHTQVKLSMHEIIYLEAMQDYTKIITPKKSYLTLTTFTALLQKLPPDRFLRIHRSYAVALKRVKLLRSSEVVCEDFTLPVGKTYRSVISQLKL